MDLLVTPLQTCKLSHAKLGGINMSQKIKHNDPRMVAFDPDSSAQGLLEVVTALEEIDRYTRCLGYSQLPSFFWPRLKEVFRTDEGAKRFVWQKSVRFCAAGRLWLGRSINVSRSGILIEVPEHCRPTGQLILEVIDEFTGSTLLILSKVVRTEKTETDATKIGMSFCSAYVPKSITSGLTSANLKLVY